MKQFEVHQKKMPPNMPIVGMAYGTTEIGYPMFRMSFSTNNELCSKSVGTYPRTRDFDVQVRHLEEERLCQNGEPGNIFLLCPLLTFFRLPSPLQILPFFSQPQVSSSLTYLLKSTGVQRNPRGS